MTVIVINGFHGAALGVDSKLLREDIGVSSLNQRPGKEDLRPWKSALVVASVLASPQRKTIYRMGQDVAGDADYWLQWAASVHPVRDFDLADTTERTLYTGDGTPKWTDNIIGLAGQPYPTAARELAVPAPLTGLVPVEDTPGPSGGTDETWSYVHTFVNDLGWESAPSPPSVDIVAKPGAIIDLNGLEAAPSGNYGITARRIYKLQTGTSGVANYFFLREIGSGTTSTQDDARKLGAQIATTVVGTADSSWQPPPTDGKCLTAMWNQMLALISGKSVRICVPGKGYAWPLRYAIKFEATPVALGVYGQRMLVLTTGDSFVVTGSDPAALAAGIKPMKFNQPCATERSVVAFPDGVAWASPDGMCWAGDSGARVLTDGLVDPETWATWSPSTMVASQYRGLLFVFYTEGGVRKGLAIDPRNPTGLYLLSAGYDAAFYDPIGKAMYVLEGNGIKKFDAGAALLTATFKSKVFRFESGRSFSAAEVVGAAYPVAVKVWADGELIVDRSITSDDTFRVPDRDAEEWQVELGTGAGSVQAFRMATTEAELR